MNLCLTFVAVALIGAVSLADAWTDGTLHHKCKTDRDCVTTERCKYHCMGAHGHNETPCRAFCYKRGTCRENGDCAKDEFCKRHHQFPNKPGECAKGSSMEQY